jgi:hypothetical protein
MLNAGPPSIPLGSYTIPTPATNAPNGGTVAWHSSGIAVAANTWTLVTFRGSIAISKNYNCDAVFDTVCPSSFAGRVAPPKGIEYGYLSDSARVRYSSGATGGIALSHDDTTSWAVFNYLYGGTLEVKRHGINGSASCTSTPDPNGPPTNCPRQGLSWPSAEEGYYALSGSHSVSAEIIVPLYLDPSSFDVAPGTAVVFTAKKHSRAQIGITHWYFRYDDVGATGLLDNPTTPLTGGTFVMACYQQSTCTFTPARSGRMYVHGAWQSKPARASAIVFVNSGRLVLNANPTNVWSGDSVTFTPSSTDGSTFAVQRWEWKPDTTPGRTAGCGEPEPSCRRPVFESGTMHVVARLGTASERASRHIAAMPDSATLVAVPTVVDTGGVVNFTPSTKSGRPYQVQQWEWIPDVPPGRTQACAPGVSVCQTSVFEAGTMKVTVQVAGVSYFATARAKPITCFTPDTLLNHQWFRDSLKALLKDSYPDTLPDTLRRERAAHVLIDKATGQLVYRRSDPDPNANNCGVENVFGYNTAQYELVATIHTHPYSIGDFVAYCGAEPLNKKTTLGGSIEDWVSLFNNDKEVQQYQPNRRVREYIIDKGNVIVLDLSGFPNVSTVYPYANVSCPWWP